jgi:hypothetical protein
LTHLDILHIDFIKKIIQQTHNLCELAVQQNSMALEYVINQTDDLCKLALDD